MAWIPSFEAKEDIGVLTENGAFRYGESRSVAYALELFDALDELATNP